MKLSTCSTCRQALFFENTRCQTCGSRLAYFPDVNEVRPFDEDGRYRLCDNYVHHDVCNWAIPMQQDSTLCLSCELNTDIPDADIADAKVVWARLETAKRRLLYSLLGLGLPIDRRSPENPTGLAFSFKSSSTDEPVFTGHSDGLITINIAEADDPFREKTRLEMGEPYRTLLGHFRHEIGHYYWDRLIKERDCLEPFRGLFGDETVHYAAEQRRHYETGPPADWPERFVSAYASMHPWEDWAETFAHYLHIVDTLETARAYGLALRPTAASGAPLPDLTARRLDFDDFDDLIGAWFPLTNALNSLNRSMGLPDVYPFVLSAPVITKLGFVHEIVEDASRCERLRANDDNVVAKSS